MLECDLKSQKGTSTASKQINISHHDETIDYYYLCCLRTNKPSASCSCCCRHSLLAGRKTRLTLVVAFILVGITSSSMTSNLFVIPHFRFTSHHKKKETALFALLFEFIVPHTSERFSIRVKQPSVCHPDFSFPQIEPSCIVRTIGNHYKV